MTFQRRPESDWEFRENFPETWKIHVYSQIKGVEEVKGVGLQANGKEYSKTSRRKELRKLEEEKEVRIRRLGHKLRPER